MAASENFVMKQVEMKYAETGSYRPIFFRSTFLIFRMNPSFNWPWSGKLLWFFTYLKHHVMSISPWLKNIFMIIYTSKHKIFQETDNFNANGRFQKLNQYKISSPILDRLLRFGEKKICSKKADINVLVISREVSLKSFNK